MHPGRYRLGEFSCGAPVAQAPGSPPIVNAPVPDPGPTADPASRPDRGGRVSRLAPVLVVVTVIVLVAVGLSAVATVGRSGPARHAGAPSVAAFGPRLAGEPAVGVNVHTARSTVTPAARDRIYAQLAAAGVTWVRLDLGWDRFEPSRGKLSPSYVHLADAAVDAARAHGLHVLATLLNTPPWANHHRATNVAPANPADYAWIARSGSRALRRAGRGVGDLERGGHRRVLGPARPGRLHGPGAGRRPGHQGR